MKAKVTISKRGGYKGEGEFHITIKDSASSMRIVEVSMSLTEFAEAIGGISECEADIELIPNEYAVARYGKKKVTERVYMDKSLILGDSKDHRQAAVNAHFLSTYSGDGWELWSDGVGTQQYSEKWQYIICKYVEE